MISTIAIKCAIDKYEQVIGHDSATINMAREEIKEIDKLNHSSINFNLNNKKFIINYHYYNKGILINDKFIANGCTTWVDAVNKLNQELVKIGFPEYYIDSFIESELK